MNNLTCVCLYVFVFPAETRVEDRQPIANQETEQPSAPGHTGTFIYHTSLRILCFSSPSLLLQPSLHLPAKQQRQLYMFSTLPFTYSLVCCLKVTALTVLGMECDFASIKSISGLLLAGYEC